MTGQVGLASVGLGWWGKVLAETAGKTGEARIVSCFARRPEGREEFAAQVGCRTATSLDDLLADPEVEGLLVATANRSHREIIEQAAAAGKAVFVEKPLTTTVEDGAAAVAAAEAAGIVLQVGHQRRRNAANRRIKQLIEAGELGDLEALEANQSIPNGFKMPEQAWRWNAEESPLGAMTSLGIHKIDSMRYHAGPIKSVFCFTRAGRSVSIDEATVVAFEFESGAVGTLITSFFVPVLSTLTVFGQDASAFNEADGTKLFLQARGGAAREEIPLEAVNPAADQLVEFARSIRGEAKPEVDGRAGLEIVSIMAAALESATTRRAVDVAEHRP